MHNKQVRQLHTCQGREKQKSWCNENAYTKYMYTYSERYLEVLPKKNEGEKLNINKQWNAMWENTVTKRTEVQKNQLTLICIWEHKAYTYLRIYTLKQNKNACIVYYVAVFLGYQVKKKKKIKLYIKHLFYIFSHMSCMYKVTLDMAGLLYHQKNKKVSLM